MAHGAGDDEHTWFEAVFRESYDAVLAYALARTTADVANDVTAKTFLVAWRRRRELPDHPLPWLIGVARKTLADERRSASRRVGLDGRLSSQRRAADGDDDPADDVADRAVVLAALADLRPADQEILRLVAWDGLTAEDAAASMGCSRSTFAVRLLRARRRLTAALARHDRAEADLDPNPEAATRRST